jgi:hypothetical protein
MNSIVPTVGRKVWFYLDGLQQEPLDATIVRVFGDTPQACVNLHINAANSAHVIFESSVQVGDINTKHRHFRWMPYQQAKAKEEAAPTAPKPDVSMSFDTLETLLGIDHTPLDAEDIARVCHQINRAYCQALGDFSQPAWDDAPMWQQSSAMLGVELHLKNPLAGVEASHTSWMAQKLNEGWVYGPVKDANAKTHPCIVPYAQLPREQQAKDFLFRAVVHELAEFA